MKELARLFGYVRYYKGQATISVTMAVITSLLDFARIPTLVPVFYALMGGEAERAKVMEWPAEVGKYLPGLEGITRRIVDAMLANPLGTMSWAIGLLIAISVVKGAALYLQEYLAGKVHTGVARRLAAELYAHVLSLPMSFYNRVGSASVASRFTNDLEGVGRGLAYFFSKAVLQPIRLVGFVALAAFINWKLLLFNAALFPLLAIGIKALGEKAKRATRRGLHSRDRLMNILQESFEGISIVKAFNMERREQARFHEENDKVRVQDLKVVRVDAATSPFTEMMGIIGVGLSLYMAGRAVLLTHEMTMLEFGAFYTALVSISDPIRKLSAINSRIQALVASATRVFSFLDEKTDIIEKPDAANLDAFSREIRFDRVSFTYNGTDEVLHGVCVTAARGEIIALVGPSGSGKSTMARLLPRFYDPSGGAVLIDGTDIRDVTLSSLRDQIGLVTQEVILFNDTIAANISYGKTDASKEEIQAAAKAANAHGFIEKLPSGYDSMVGEKGLVLSGGQRQRIALARAILKDPPILILDEATSSLDSESEHLIQEALDEFMRDRTSIVIAHRLSTVKRASRIYVIDAGTVAASGTNETLLRDCPMYKNLYRRQFMLAEPQGD